VRRGYISEFNLRKNMTGGKDKRGKCERRKRKDAKNEVEGVKNMQKVQKSLIYV
jgi:hypothetical protein